MPGVTAIILSYKRQQNIRIIIDRLLSTGIVTQIIVWNNNPEIQYQLDGVMTINASHNHKAIARYAAAMLSENDTILFNDDDWLFNADDIVALYAQQQCEPDRIFGFMGRNLQDGQYMTQAAFGDVDIVLGQFMLFSKNLLSRVYGKILALTPFERGDDIAFSLLVGGKHFCVDVPRQDLETDNSVALWRAPNHFQLRQLMVERVLRLSSIQSV